MTVMMNVSVSVPRWCIVHYLIFPHKINELLVPSNIHKKVKKKAGYTLCDFRSSETKDDVRERNGRKPLEKWFSLGFQAFPAPQMSKPI